MGEVILVDPCSQVPIQYLLGVDNTVGKKWVVEVAA